MPHVRFVRRGSSLVVDAAHGEDILHLALRSGLPMASSCAGEGACKACRIEVLVGAERLSAAEERELQALASAKCAPGERLACLARVFGDVTITTSYW